MVNYTAMGNRMKMKRRSRKLSQEDVAMAVQISPSYYGNIERGRRIPSVDTLVAIANYLDVGIDFLLAQTQRVVLFGQIVRVLLPVCICCLADDALERRYKLRFVNARSLSADRSELKPPGSLNDHIITHAHLIVPG